MLVQWCSEVIYVEAVSYAQCNFWTRLVSIQESLQSQHGQLPRERSTGPSLIGTTVKGSQGLCADWCLLWSWCCDSRCSLETKSTLVWGWRAFSPGLMTWALQPLCTAQLGVLFILRSYNAHSQKNCLFCVLIAVCWLCGGEWFLQNHYVSTNNIYSSLSDKDVKHECLLAHYSRSVLFTPVTNKST